MASSYVEFINATNRWTRNQISKAGQLVVRMVSITLPKAMPILHSSNTSRRKSKTSITADALDGNNFTAKDLEDFWYNSKQVWPPEDE